MGWQRQKQKTNNKWIYRCEKAEFLFSFLVWYYFFCASFLNYGRISVGFFHRAYYYARSITVSSDDYPCGNLAELWFINVVSGNVSYFSWTAFSKGILIFFSTENVYHFINIYIRAGEWWSSVKKQCWWSWDLYATMLGWFFLPFRLR